MNKAASDQVSALIVVLETELESWSGRRTPGARTPGILKKTINALHGLSALTSTDPRARPSWLRMRVGTVLRSCFRAAPGRLSECHARSRTAHQIYAVLLRTL